MKIKSKALEVCLLVLLPGSLWATGAVDLGTASSFAVLAGSTITNTGPSLVQGDLGLSPGSAVSGFPPGLIMGTQYIANAVAEQAKADLVTAYNDVAGRIPVTTVATELGGSVLIPGVYNSASGTFGITGILTLDAQGDPEAVFVFQMESTLITASGSQVVVLNGASECNVFWQVGSSATLGTDSHLCGNILALTTITLNTGASVSGRILARNGAVTLDTNEVAVVICAGPVDANEQPVSLELRPAYPNPFNPSTTIDFSLSQMEHVTLTVHNLMGQQVAILQDGLLDRGAHSVEFTAVGLSSGVYTYTLQTGEFRETRSFTLVK